MKVLIKNVSEILSSKTTIEQRGLLITAILCKDVDPKITLAKFKVYVDLKKYKLEMVFLHENKYISWSGYKTAKKSLLMSLNSKDVYSVINFMNVLYKRNFDAKSTSTSTNLTARLQNYTVEQVKLVISNRYEVWKNDSVMSQHLNPTTIFRKSKFEKYLEEAERTKVGSGIVAAKNIDLKTGDELAVKNTNDLIDSELYSVKKFKVNNGTGNGIGEKILGKELKKIIKIQNNIEKSDGDKEFLYTFVEK